MSHNTTPSPAQQQQARALSELIEIVGESAGFYREAAQATQDPGLKTLFRGMAGRKTVLADAMSRAIPPHITARMAAVDDCPVAGTVRTLRERLRTLRAGRQAAYAERVRDVEDRQLKATLSIMDRDMPMRVKEVIRRHLRALYQHQDLLDRGIAAHERVA